MPVARVMPGWALLVCVVLFLCCRVVWCLTHGTTIQGLRTACLGGAKGCAQESYLSAGLTRMGRMWVLSPTHGGQHDWHHKIMRR